MQETTRFTIDSKLLQSVVDYLTTRPFSEVNQLVAAIQADAKAVEAVKDEPLKSFFSKTQSQQVLE